MSCNFISFFFFYFFHELALIPTFIMVGVWGGRDRGYAAMKMTIYLTAGALLSLLGLIAIYVKSGAESFDLITLREVLAAEPMRVMTQKYIFGLLVFGFEDCLAEAYASYDTGAFVENVCLAAFDKGLGTCVIATVIRYPELLRRMLPGAGDKRFVIAVTLGYPDLKAPDIV